MPDKAPADQEGILNPQVSAGEALKSDRVFPPEEQNRFVFSILDPDIASEVLAAERDFTNAEREYLASTLESEPESVYLFFMHLAESGALEDLTEREAWLVERLKPALLQIDEPSAKEYIQTAILPLLRGL